MLIWNSAREAKALVVGTESAKCGEAEELKIISLQVRLSSVGCFEGGRVG